MRRRLQNFPCHTSIWRWISIIKKSIEQYGEPVTKALFHSPDAGRRMKNHYRQNWAREERFSGAFWPIRTQQWTDLPLPVIQPIFLTPAGLPPNGMSPPPVYGHHAPKPATFCRGSEELPQKGVRSMAPRVVGRPSTRPWPRKIPNECAVRQSLNTTLAPAGRGENVACSAARQIERPINSLGALAGAVGRCSKAKKADVET